MTRYSRTLTGVVQKLKQRAGAEIPYIIQEAQKQNFIQYEQLSAHNFSFPRENRSNR